MRTAVLVRNRCPFIGITVIWPDSLRKPARLISPNNMISSSTTFPRCRVTTCDQLKVTTAEPLITCGHLRAGVSGAMKNLITLVVMALLAVPSLTKADVEDRLYDFTDAYYLQNGVNPALIVGRMQPGTGNAVNDTPHFPFQRNVRALLTLPAYDHSGDINYFTVLGGISANAFTNNAAGRQARAIPDSFTEFLVPKAGADPIGFTFRQSSLLDMRHGFFGADPLGIWIHKWVNFSSTAL